MSPPQRGPPSTHLKGELPSSHSVPSNDLRAFLKLTTGGMSHTHSLFHWPRPQCLEQCLAHSWCSIKVCYFTKWAPSHPHPAELARNTQAHPAPCIKGLASLALLWNFPDEMVPLCVNRAFNLSSLHGAGSNLLCYGTAVLSTSLHPTLTKVQRPLISCRPPASAHSPVHGAELPVCSPPKTAAHPSTGLGSSTLPTY